LPLHHQPVIVMSDAIIYFGAPAKNQDSAPAELRSRGLNYLRASPSSIDVNVTLEYRQPGFTLYKNNLPAFIKAARHKAGVSSRKPIYHAEPHTTVPPFMANPRIIWSYNNKLTPEQIDQKKRIHSAKETQIKGRLAFEAMHGGPQWWRGLKDDNPVTVTASNSTNMNMAGYVTYTVLNRLVDQFFRVNQYPAFKRNNKEDVMAFLFNYMNPSDDNKDVILEDGTVRTFWVYPDSS